MAKNVSQKNSSYSLQFLFYETESNQLQAGSLSEFASKIRDEYMSRADICCICQTEPVESDEHQLIRYVTERPDDIEDVTRDAYVVILENACLEGQLNPNDFFRMDLPEISARKAYYEISFKGKKGVTRGG